MPDMKLEAVVSAVDKNASATFQKIASGADKMGTAVDQAAAKGAKGLKDSAKSADDLNKRMAALGAVATSVAGFLSNAGRASEESAQVQRQLEQAIANTGESYSTYADRIEAAGARAVQLGIDDEKASQAIQALTEITGSASTALDYLGLAQDLAAAKGMDLVTAAELVGRVSEGNTGILARQGIVVAENATASAALAQIQQQVAGQAEAHASAIDRLTVQYGNLMEQVGGSLGQFAPLVGMLPGLSIGFSAVGSAVGALAPNLTKAGAASAALDLAMGPVGIVAGAAAAAVGIYALADAMSTSYSEDAKQAEKATKDLTTAINGLAASSDPLALIGSTWKEMANQIVGSDVIAAEIKRVTDEMDSLNRGNTDNPEVIAHFNALAKELDALDESASRADDFMRDLTTILIATGPAADGAREKVNQLLNDFATKKRGPLDTVIAIDELAAALPEMNREMIATTEAAKQSDTAIGRATRKMVMMEAAAYSMAAATQAAGGAVKQQTAEQAAAETRMNALEGAAYSMAGAQQDVAKQTNAANAELQAAGNAALEYAKALVGAQSFASQLRPVDLAPRGGDKVTGTAADLQLTASVLDSVLGTFKQIDSLGQAADQAGSIAQNLIGDPGELGILDGLLKKGRISQEQYDDALKAGNTIRKESGAIENDLNTIRAKQLPLLAEADQRYGNVIDKISRMDAAEAQATLGFMDANEAMKAQNALSLVAAASMGELGEAGKQATTDMLQGAVDADPVLGAMLEKMGLISIGADGTVTVHFDEGAEVKATLDDVVSSIDQLAIAIDLLDGKPDLQITVKYLADIAQARKAKAIVDSDIQEVDGAIGTFKIQGDGTQANDTIQNVADNLGNLPDTTVTISAADNASGVIENIRNLITQTDGMSATTYMNTVYQQVGTPGGGAAAGPGGRNGGVFSFANGGVVELGEAGQELLKFANGGMAMAVNHGLYAVPNQTLVYPAPATKAKMAGMGGGQTFNITVQGDINGMSGVNEVMAAFKTAAREHFAGFRG